MPIISPNSPCRLLTAPLQDDRLSERPWQWQNQASILLPCCTRASHRDLYSLMCSYLSSRERDVRIQFSWLTWAVEAYTACSYPLWSWKWSHLFSFFLYFFPSHRDAITYVQRLMSWKDLGTTCDQQNEHQPRVEFQWEMTFGKVPTEIPW